MVAAVICCFSVIVSGMVPVFVISEARLALDKVPFLLTLFAVLFKLLWSQAEVSFRAAEPYADLYRGRASLRALRCDYTGVPVFILPFLALGNGHFLLAWIALASIMVETVVICTSALSDSTLSTTTIIFPDSPLGVEYIIADNEFWATFGLAIGLPLSSAFILGIATIWRWRTRLIRDPGTIAAVFLYTKDTAMIHDVIRPRSSKQTFAFGWFPIRDTRRLAFGDSGERSEKWNRGW